MVKLFSKNSNLCDHNLPTSQTDRQTDGQTDSDRNTALCTKVHRAVKMIWPKFRFFNLRWRTGGYIGKHRFLAITRQRIVRFSPNFVWRCKIRLYWRIKVKICKIWKSKMLDDHNLENVRGCAINPLTPTVVIWVHL